MNGEMKGIGKKAFITSIKALSSHSPAVTEEIQEKFKMANVPAPLKYKSVTAAPTRSLTPVSNFSSFTNMKTGNKSLLCVHFVNFMQKKRSKYNLSIRCDQVTTRAFKMNLISLWIYLS